MWRSTPPWRSARGCDGRPPSGSVRHAPTIGPPSSTDLHVRHDRHARTDIDVRIGVEDDLDRHALNHLHEIAGRVFRRQHAERSAAAGLDAVDVAGEGAVRISVDMNLHMLAWAHLSELRLLEVC